MVMEDPDIAPYLENTIKPSSINNNNNCHQATSSENVSNSGDTHESEPRLEIVSQPENAPPKDNSQVVTAESNTLVSLLLSEKVSHLVLAFCVQYVMSYFVFVARKL